MPTKDNAPSLAAASEGGHTTRFQVPPESEVNKAIEPSALHHGDSSEVLVHVGDDGPTRRMHLEEDEVGSAQTGRAGDTAINTTATSG